MNHAHKNNGTCSDCSPYATTAGVFVAAILVGTMLVILGLMRCADWLLKSF